MLQKERVFRKTAHTLIKLVEFSLLTSPSLPEILLVKGKTPPLPFGELKDTIPLVLEGDDEDEEEHRQKDRGSLKVPS